MIAQPWRIRRLDGALNDAPDIVSGSGRVSIVESSAGADGRGNWLIVCRSLQPVNSS